MIVVRDIEQGTDEWFALRSGVVSASNFHKIITPTGKASTQARDYMFQLIGQRVYQVCDKGYKSENMQNGNDREPQARALFEFINEVDVEQVAFVFKDESKKVGCSPDGLIDGSGLEIKSPLLKTHIEYSLSDTMPTKYYCQVQGSMWICETDHWYFMSYYPSTKEHIVCVERDDSFIKSLETKIAKFVCQLDELTEIYKEKIKWISA